jgi:hypothetical protein
MPISSIVIVNEVNSIRTDVMFRSAVDDGNRRIRGTDGGVFTPCRAAHLCGTGFRQVRIGYNTPFIIKDAVIADWPADPKAPNAEYRVLRAGTSDWTCLPGIPGYSHDEPMCLDKISMQWIKDSLAERPVHIDQVGVMYMFSGAWVPDLHGTSPSADHTYHVGPHAMIITPHNEDLAKFNRDGSTGQIYISHLPGHSELYLIIPFKDWPPQ